MPRTRRQWSSVLTVALLLPCLAVGGVWVRSHWVRDWVRFQSVHGGAAFCRDRAEVLTHPGVLYVALYRTRYAADSTPGLREREARDDGVRWDTLDLREWNPQFATRAQRMGFMYQQGGSTLGAGFATTHVAAPFWALALATGVVPVARVVRRALRQRVRRRGVCPSCGYDLRASPDRCPECGEVVRGHEDAEASGNPVGEAAGAAQ
jgi:hypothetical protein